EVERDRSTGRTPSTFTRTRSAPRSNRMDRSVKAVGVKVEPIDLEGDPLPPRGRLDRLMRPSISTGGSMHFPAYITRSTRRRIRVPRPGAAPRAAREPGLALAEGTPRV